MVNIEIKLGVKVRDIVTGAVGTITGKADYLNETSKYLFEYLNNVGSICSSWYESGRFEVIDENGVNE